MVQLFVREMRWDERVCEREERERVGKRLYLPQESEGAHVSLALKFLGWRSDWKNSIWAEAEISLLVSCHRRGFKKTSLNEKRTHAAEEEVESFIRLFILSVCVLVSLLSLVCLFSVWASPKVTWTRVGAQEEGKSSRFFAARFSSFIFAVTGIRHFAKMSLLRLL